MKLAFEWNSSEEKKKYQLWNIFQNAINSYWCFESFPQAFWPGIVSLSSDFKAIQIKKPDHFWYNIKYRNCLHWKKTFTSLFFAFWMLCIETLCSAVLSRLAHSWHSIHYSRTMSEQLVASNDECMCTDTSLPTHTNHITQHAGPHPKQMWSKVLDPIPFMPFKLPLCMWCACIMLGHWILSVLPVAAWHFEYSFLYTHTRMS